ncbi:MAG: asparagine synthase-related protein [Betaproteobacteria bacterium]|nr:asparagine synthase-related protein [Betaproteobacteria bacterium]
MLVGRRSKHRVQLPSRLQRYGQVAQLAMLEGAFGSLARELEERSASRLQLELRQPYMSQAMVEFALRTPDRTRSHGNRTKWLHRRAMRGLLPELVLKRSSKAVFSSVFHWQLQEVSKELAGEIAVRRSDWIRLDQVAALRAVGVDAENFDSTAWKLWSLVGCDAVAIE